MKSGCLLVAGLMAISTTASAGVYVGLGVGTEPGINDEMARTAVPVGRSLRGLGGIRFGRFSIEGALNGFGVVVNRHANQDVFQLSAAAKYNHPLGDGFEAFGRAGLERTWLNNFSGNGFLVGAGFEYRLDLLITNASLFVDYTIHHATLTDTRGQVGETSRIWALGFTFGI